MIVKFKLFEKFLELEKFLPYTYIGSEIINDKNGNFYYCIYRYDFRTPDGVEYRLGLFYYYDKMMSMEWSNKEQFESKQKKEIFKFDKTSSININYLYKIMNTIFKIILDFYKEHKNYIDYFSMGSFTKSKYKLYKEIISDIDEFKIINDYIVTQDKLPFYEIEFILK